MTAPLVRRRPRRPARSGAFFVVLASFGALLAPGSAGAQEPDTVRAPVPDTVSPVPDTLLGVPPQPDSLAPIGPVPDSLLPQDTVPEDTVRPPPPALVRIDPVGPASWSRGVWEWDRDALRRLPALSLLHLLERLPGVVPVRTDIVNQPEAVSVFGATAGAIRYVVDGFELDPLTSPTFDPSRFPLLALERVRVERRVTGATVRIETLSPDSPSPRSIIEAGTGDLDVNLFRGIFLAPDVLGGPLALGFERLASAGFLPDGSSNHVAGWVKWSWVRDSTGIQVEYRQGDMDRGGVEESLLGVRRDWAVRARTALGPLRAEAYAGASSVEDERGERVLREGTPQGGVRLRSAFDGPLPVDALGALRFRDHPRLPAAELELGVRTRPFGLLALEAEAAQGWWRQGPSTGRWAGRVQVGPVLGVRAFAEVFRGEPLLTDGFEIRAPSPDSLPIRAVRDGVRAGAELAWGGLRLGAAAVRTTMDTLPGFGLPFEPPGLGLAGGEATGLEVTARVPILWDPLAVEGWYVGMQTDDPWLYLPEHNWRAGLVYHDLPLESGNLELFVRLEHVFRGRMNGPAAPPAEGEPDPAPLALEEVGSYRSTNLELSIRIVAVRAFLRWETLRNRPGRADLPGYVLPGQRVLYGVKWEFLN